jgi:hypothetical protein
LGEERCCTFGVVVVVEKVNANGVCAGRTTSNSDTISIATESRNVLLHELEQELLIAKAKVQKALTLEDLRGQETQRVDLLFVRPKPHLIIGTLTL